MVFEVSLYSENIDERIYLKPYEASILNIFFRNLLEESEAGFVFLGKKPMCIHGFYVRNLFLKNLSFHKEAIACKQGEYILDSLSKNQSLRNKEIIIHICKNIDPLIQSCRHILIINIPLFKRMINDNICLFQHILGPAITSEKILDSLILDDMPFHSFLKHENVLVGKLLGYGTQNSLYGSRIEFILKTLDTTIPPFMSGENMQTTQPHEFSPFKPSIGYKTLGEELEDLQKNMKVSSPPLIREKPAFVYGWLSTCKEEIIIDELEETQKKIQNLLRSKSITKRILEILYKNEFYFDSDYSQLDLSNFCKEEILSKTIYKEMKKYDPQFTEGFYQGLKGNTDYFKTLGVCEDTSLFDVFDFKEIKANLIDCDEFFKNHLTMKSCLIPNRLYCEVTQEGKEEGKSHNYMWISYSIQSADKKNLSSENEVLVNLNNTIPGFRLGVRGMKIGEKRKIWIHPELAYGIETLRNDKYFKVNVSLLGTVDAPSDCIKDEKLVQSNTLNFILEDEFEESMASLYKYKLYKAGEYLRNILTQDSIDFEKLVSKLMKIGETESSEIANHSNEISEKIFWNIFFTKNEREIQHDN